MLEYTLKNKKVAPIMTLTAPLLEKLLAARPESAHMVLHKHVRNYEAVTGKKLTLNPEQHQALLQRAGANAQGMWVSEYSQLPAPWYLLQTTFRNGFLVNTDTDGMVADLELVESFYALLDKRNG